MLMQLGIFCVGQAFTGHDDHIPSSQLVLVMAERFANYTLEPVALDRKLDAFLSNHKTQARVIERVVARKDQEVLPRNLAGRGVKDRLELPGNQQSLAPAEVLTHLPVPAISDGQTLAAFGTAARQNGAAVLGGHASTEAVSASALDGAGLESAFHG